MPEFKVLPTPEASQKIARTNPLVASRMNQRYPYYAIACYADGSSQPICGVFGTETGNKIIEGWKISAAKSIFAKELLRD